MQVVQVMRTDEENAVKRVSRGGIITILLCTVFFVAMIVFSCQQFFSPYMLQATARWCVGYRIKPRYFPMSVNGLSPDEKR